MQHGDGRREKADTHLLLRAPKDLASRLNQMLDSANDEMTDPISIEFKEPRKRREIRKGWLTVGPEKHEFDIKDLPCIIECHKTFDNEMIYKTGDISQIIHIKPKEGSAEAMDVEHKSTEKENSALAEIEKKINDPRYENSGITPPTRHIRVDRFRYPPVKRDRVQRVVKILDNIVQEKPIVQRELIQVAVDKDDPLLYQKKLFITRKPGKLTVSQRLTPRHPFSTPTPSIVSQSPMPPPQSRTPRRTTPGRSPVRRPSPSPMLYSGTSLGGRPGSDLGIPSLQPSPQTTSPAPPSAQRPSPASTGRRSSPASRRSTPGSSRRAAGGTSSPTWRPIAGVPVAPSLTTSTPPPSLSPAAATAPPAVPTVPTASAGPDPKVAEARERREKAEKAVREAKVAVEGARNKVESSKNPARRARAQKALKGLEEKLKQAEEELESATKALKEIEGY